MTSDPDERTTATGYDLWAPLYDDADPSTWLDEPFLLEQLQPFPGCRILDLGCGTGRYLRLLPPGSYRVTAMDLSLGMLSRARAASGRIDTAWVQGSATSLPFQVRSFDRIMSGLVLDHVASPGQLFRGIAGMLSPRGRAVVAGVHPEMQRVTGPDIDVANEQSVVRIHGHIHEVTELLAAVRQANLTVDAIEEPPVTRAMVERRPAWKRKLGCPALILLALESPREPASLHSSESSG